MNEGVASDRTRGGRIGSRLRRLKSLASGRAMDLGILPYRQIVTREPETWNAEYATDGLDHYAGLPLLSRSTLLLGYLDYLGGSPEVLEIGCGVGLLRERMERSSFARYVGIDVSAVAIARAEALSDERTTFLVGELPPAEVGPFDVVVMSDVLQCVPDPARTLDSVRSSLRRGGALLTAISSHRGDGALHKLVEHRFERIDSVFARNEQKSFGWRVSMYRLPTDGSSRGSSLPGSGTSPRSPS